MAMSATIPANEKPRNRSRFRGWSWYRWMRR